MPTQSKGFKDLLKKRPKSKDKESESCCGPEIDDDQRPRFWLDDKVLPVGTMSKLEIGKEYMAKVVMVSRTINDTDDKTTSEASFRIVSINPSPESDGEKK